MKKYNDIVLKIQNLISKLRLEVPYNQIYFEKDRSEHYKIATSKKIINFTHYNDNKYIVFCSNLSIILEEKNIDRALICFDNNLVSDIETIGFDENKLDKSYFRDLNPIVRKLIDSVFHIFLSKNYITMEEDRIKTFKFIFSILITLKINESFKFFQYFLYLTQEIYKLNFQDTLDFFYNETTHPYFDILFNKTPFSESNTGAFWLDSIIHNKNIDHFNVFYIDLNKYLNAKINREKTIIRCYRLLDNIKVQEKAPEKEIDISNSVEEKVHSANSIPVFLCDENSFPGVSKRRQGIFNQLLANKNKLLKNPQDADNKLEQLKKEFPNFENVISHMQEEYILSQASSLPYFHFSPILLSGEPGIGKTFFTQKLSECLGLPKYFFNSGANSTGFVLNGHSEGWTNGQEGFIFKSLMNCPFANPFMVFDEIDKVSHNNHYPVESTYLSLLEEHTAKNFIDEYFEFGADCSHINIIATANDIFRIPTPLLSRFSLFEIPLPNLEERIIFSKSILSKIVEQKNISIDLSSIPHEFWKEICKEKGSLRDIDKTIKRSLTNSIKRNKENLILLPEDISNYKTKTSPSIGFLN